MYIFYEITVSKEMSELVRSYRSMGNRFLYETVLDMTDNTAIDIYEEEIKNSGINIGEIS